MAYSPEPSRASSTRIEVSPVDRQIVAERADFAIKLHADLHVIEEPDPRLYGVFPGAIEGEFNADRGFARRSTDCRRACRLRDKVACLEPVSRRECRPGRPHRCNPHRTESEVLCKLHVGLAVPEDERSVPVNGRTFQVSVDQPDFRLPALAPLSGAVRTDEDPLEVDSFACEEAQYLRLYELERFRRIAPRSQTILVADHDEGKSGINQKAQASDNPGDEFNLLK